MFLSLLYILQTFKRLSCKKIYYKKNLIKKFISEENRAKNKFNFS